MKKRAVSRVYQVRGHLEANTQACPEQATLIPDDRLFGRLELSCLAEPQMMFCICGAPQGMLKPAVACEQSLCGWTRSHAAVTA